MIYSRFQFFGSPMNMRILVTPEKLQRMIADGETMTVEFKGEARRSLSDKDLVEAVVCLANRTGDEPAWLLIGVEDDGQVTGARPRHEAGNIDPRRVQALIANRTRPSVSCRANVADLGGHPVLWIEVPASRTPVGTSDGVFVHRVIGGHGKPECQPLHFHEMQGLLASRGAMDWSALVADGVAWDDLDPLEFERFRRTIRENPGRGDPTLLDLPDLELAKALGVVDADRKVRSVRTAGVLLFGREETLRRAIPTHEVAFQVLEGTTVRVNDFFRWPLVRVMEEFLSRYRARVVEDELMIGLVRIGVPSYPEPAFREGVANALLHRDYTSLGAVHVQWHKDRIVVMNPGGFPAGVRLDNLLVTGPRPRNPLLADAFKRAGLVERTARGVDTIFHEVLRTGRRAPTYARDTQTDIALTLPGGPADLAYVRFLVEERRADRPLGLSDLLVLDRVRTAGKVTVDEVAPLIQADAGEATVVLERLVQIRLLRGQTGAGGVLTMTLEARRRIPGKKVLEVTPEDQRTLEAQVLEHATRTGRINRGDVMELCGLGPHQASRLLRGMVEAGSLRLHGTRKAAWYEPR